MICETVIYEMTITKQISETEIYETEIYETATYESDAAIFQAAKIHDVATCPAARHSVELQVVAFPWSTSDRFHREATREHDAPRSAEVPKIMAIVVCWKARVNLVPVLVQQILVD